MIVKISIKFLVVKSQFEMNICPKQKYGRPWRHPIYRNRTMSRVAYTKYGNETKLNYS